LIVSHATRRAIGARIALCACVSAIALGAAHPTAIRAQEVGYNPEHSPYHDIDQNHAYSLLLGYWKPSFDEAGVTPREGPLVGLRYDLLIGKSPVFMVARVAHVFDERTIINPTYPVSIRVRDPHAPASLNIADIGLGLQLTGHKTFHRLAPTINVGVGTVSDLGGAGGPGHYHLGTQFAAVYGAGIRWLPDGALSRLSLRLDANNYMYQHHLPRSFHTITADGTTAIPLNKPLTQWRNNGAYTLGVWYAFFR
jgi:hypothetical protein